MGCFRTIIILHLLLFIKFIYTADKTGCWKCDSEEECQKSGIDYNTNGMCIDFPTCHQVKEGEKVVIRGCGACPVVTTEPVRITEPKIKPEELSTLPTTDTTPSTSSESSSSSSESSSSSSSSSSSTSTSTSTSTTTTTPPPTPPPEVSSTEVTTDVSEVTTDPGEPPADRSAAPPKRKKRNQNLLSRFQRDYEAGGEEEEGTTKAAQICTPCNGFFCNGPAPDESKLPADKFGQETTTELLSSVLTTAASVSNRISCKYVFIVPITVFILYI